MDGCAEMDLTASVVSNYNRWPLTYHVHRYREATCCHCSVCTIYNLGMPFSNSQTGERSHCCRAFWAVTYECLYLEMRAQILGRVIVNSLDFGADLRLGEGKTVLNETRYYLCLNFFWNPCQPPSCCIHHTPFTAITKTVPKGGWTVTLRTQWMVCGQ
jgi:hypothetical protein